MMLYTIPAHTKAHVPLRGEKDGARQNENENKNDENRDAPWGGVLLSYKHALFEIAGAKSLSFRDITFRGAQATGVSVYGSTNTSLVNCRVDAVGGTGILVSGGSDVRIENVTVSGAGGSGVFVSGGDAAQLLPSRHVVEGSEVRDFSRTCFTYEPGLTIKGVGVRCSHNEVRRD
jgi:hypothetical protein